MYLGNITAEVKSLGFPLDKLFTHLGGESRSCHMHAIPVSCWNVARTRLDLLDGSRLRER